MTNSLLHTSTPGLKLSNSPEATHQIGVEVGQKLKRGAILALHGDLGAGKTTFVEGVVEGVLGKKIAIDSPTFTYLNIYEGKVFHFDLYRLKNGEQFLEMGFEEFLFEGVACIEWSERIEALLPEETIHIEFSHREGGRCLTSKMFDS
ncbi:MAG: tRNA threonylcarbamoyladenosine biosynthesis protein TsaE [Chlamydiales bacterium]|nr:tRNA threonylcarbamoyladenosine biosynthesis protein TsaE [Chlamydiales bacterium]MCH9636164.1 tRNA threonylcarbamoyladenosine biosynthesis protein TsaE [Chlamydiales bacterium]MCH9703814.1 tRNA (adenosine(37)-N6)-threonylcarbamoyltransferase complex ATPase subunit type 1 TsaE [Chlamydiota bacterium]